MLEALPAGPPRLVGPYRLLARLGSGGMGEVHLACRSAEPTADPYRMVAVKTVRADLDVDGEFRTRFRREITAARAVHSPYAAALVDGDADARTPWLATAYVPGPSLAEAVDRAGPLPVAAVRALGTALARALEAVHAARVLHRDLKPANVLLSADGPKLIDFGIARAFDATALTSAGLVVGTPGFMAPEHLEGGRAVVPATDVFCLGALLVFAATGRGPFDDEEPAAVIYRISRADADLDAVPGELRGAVARCLLPDPARRPSAAELAGLLAGDVRDGGVFPWPGGVLSLVAGYREAARRYGEAAASGAGVADLPTAGPSVPYSPTALAGHAPAPAPAPVPAAGAGRAARWRVAAAAVAAVVIGAVGAVVLRDGAGEPPGVTGPPGVPGVPGEAVAGGKPGPGPRPTVLPYGGEGRTGDFGPAATDLAVRPAGWSPWTARVPAGTGPCALGGDVLVCPAPGGGAVALRAADGGELWSVPGRGAEPRPVAQAPVFAGELVYLTGGDGVRAYEWDGGREVWREAGPSEEYAVKGTDAVGGVLYTTYVGRDGSTGGLVTARRLGGGREELWRAPLDAFPEDPVAAGGLVYVPVGDGLVALDARTGERAARTGAGETCWHAVARPALGVVLCEGAGEGGIRVLDARTLRPLRTVADGLLPVAGPAVSAKGVLLLGGTGALYAYDLRTGRRLWREETESPTADQVYVAGDRVLLGDGLTVTAYGLEAPGEPDAVTFRAPGTAEDEGGSAQAIVAGGVVFVSRSDGVVVSGYAP